MRAPPPPSLPRDAELNMHKRLAGGLPSASGQAERKKDEGVAFFNAADSRSRSSTALALCGCVLS